MFPQYPHLWARFYRPDLHTEFVRLMALPETIVIWYGNIDDEGMFAFNPNNSDVLPFCDFIVVRRFYVDGRWNNDLVDAWLTFHHQGDNVNWPVEMLG